MDPLTNISTTQGKVARFRILTSFSMFRLCCPNCSFLMILTAALRPVTNVYISFLGHKTLLLYSVQGYLVALSVCLSVCLSRKATEYPAGS